MGLNSEQLAGTPYYKEVAERLQATEKTKLGMPAPDFADAAYVRNTFSEEGAQVLSPVKIESGQVPDVTGMSIDEVFERVVSLI